MSAKPRSIPLSHRLRVLQSEISALEDELADPSNPLLVKEKEDDNIDPGELIRGLVDVRARLDKMRKGREGREKLVNVVLESDPESSGDEEKGERITDTEKQDNKKSDIRGISEIDRRVGELEKLVGSSSAALDEVCTKFFLFMFFSSLRFPPVFSLATTIASTHNATQCSTDAADPAAPY